MFQVIDSASRSCFLKQIDYALKHQPLRFEKCKHRRCQQQTTPGPVPTPWRPPIGCLVSCPCCAMPVRTWSALDQVWGAPWSTKQGCKLEQNALFPDKLRNQTRGDWRFNMRFLVNWSWKSKFRISWQIEPHVFLLRFLQGLFFGMGLPPTPLDSPTEIEHAWPCWLDLLRIPNRFGSKNSQIPVLPGHVLQVLHASLLPQVWLQQTASHCSEGQSSLQRSEKVEKCRARTCSKPPIATPIVTEWHGWKTITVEWLVRTISGVT